MNTVNLTRIYKFEYCKKNTENKLTKTMNTNDNKRDDYHDNIDGVTHVINSIDTRFYLFN